MRNIENLFKNIRYSQELVIKELVSAIEPYIENTVSINSVVRNIGVSRSEGGQALKDLAIAEVIVFNGEKSKKTRVTITDVKTFNLIRERFGLPIYEEEGD